MTFGRSQRTVLDHFERMTITRMVYQPTAQEIAERCDLRVEQVRGALKRLRSLGLVGATPVAGRTAARWTLLPIVEVRPSAV